MATSEQEVTGTHARRDSAADPGPESAKILDKALDRALSDYHDMGRDVSSEDIADVRMRAHRLIQESRARGVTGATIRRDQDEMNMLSLAAGLPVPRILFTHMVDCATATPKQKKVWRRTLKKMATNAVATKTGCIQIKFYDTTECANNTAFFVFDRCGADHDLGAELTKIYSRMLPDKHQAIRDNLSTLLFLGRSAYYHMFTANSEILDKITKRLPEEFNYEMLRVDLSNSTLCLPPPCTVRVGMYIRFLSEIEATSVAETDLSV